MEKNVSGQKWIVFAFNITTNAAVTGDAANITANLRLDGGAAQATTDVNPAELEDGYYSFDLTQAETNADLILICPASSTADVQVIGVPGALYTTPASFNDLVVANIDTTISSRSSHSAADIWAVVTRTLTSGTKDTEIDAILEDTGTSIPSQIAGLNNFNPATQEVTTDLASRNASKADVSLLDVAVSTRSSHSAADVWSAAIRTITGGNVTADNMRGTDGAVTSLSGIALEASVQTAITDIGNLNDFNPAIETVTTDTASREASKADVSALALEASVAALNDFNPATDIVAHVTLVDTVTANTDMRGTDGAVTSLAGISTFNPATDEVITDTASRNASKADVSALALEASVQGAITDIAGLQTDITEILGYTSGDWEIINNQMIFKNELGAEIARYNLTKAGVPDSDAPDKREKV